MHPPDKMDVQSRLWFGFGYKYNAYFHTIAIIVSGVVYINVVFPLPTVPTSKNTTFAVMRE